MRRFRRSGEVRRAPLSARAERRPTAWSLAALSLAAAVVCTFLAPAAALGASEPSVSEAKALGPAATQALVTLPWGDADGQVGLARTNEGLTRGPEALAIAPDGRIAVLDAVNHRLVLLDQQGRRLGKIPVGLAQPRFLAVDDGLLYVLDADVQMTLATYKWSGVLVGTRPMPAVGDVVTGLFATSQGPCVEIAHRDSLLLEGSQAAPSAASGRSATETSSPHLAGRPVDREMRSVASATYKHKDGVRLRTANVETSTLLVADTKETQPVLASGKPIDHLVSLDGDGHGGVLIGARLAEPHMSGQTAYALAITRVTSGTQSPVAEQPVLLLRESGFAYLGQPYVVAPDGRVFQPAASERGYSIFIHTFSEVKP